MPLSMLSLPRAHIAYPPIVQTKISHMRQRLMQCRKKMRLRKGRMRERSDAPRNGRAEGTESGSPDGLALHFVNQEVCSREWGRYVEGEHS